ncbi:glycosyl hydrolase family 28-related protein [Fictibacillus sp. KU28468]|uniref:glycosyl hydrolase family 28-related protein n=1 Tax=Fictibacillus sp. KU28468 TaxID=2991053 RepID=UPI00223DB9FD|nr:glycosyl hydrolase family 28-related protein [Fictibacillus sp. KU28468]UZJ79377.1 glycoside hydrolase family 55 protein [Fictibacillus sp. KU28468]
MKKRCLLAIFILGLAAVMLTRFYEGQPKQAVAVEDYGADGTDAKDDSKAIQKAINSAASTKIGKVMLSGNKHYVLSSGITVKEGVELEFGQNTKVWIEGNFRAFTLHKNASLINGILEVTSPKFHSEVIYLDGKEKFWSADRTRVDNVTILNSSGSHKGTAVKLYTGGRERYISFVNFTGLSIIGFHQGVELTAEKPAEKKSWINGNRFVNMTMDDCVRYITINSSVTVPNEGSGNQFQGLQIQLTPVSQQILQVSGMNNTFEGMVWDVQTVRNPEGLVELSKQSSQNELHLNLEGSFVKDEGTRNSLSP